MLHSLTRFSARSLAAKARRKKRDAKRLVPLDLHLHTCTRCGSALLDAKWISVASEFVCGKKRLLLLHCQELMCVCVSSSYVCQTLLDATREHEALDERAAATQVNHISHTHTHEHNFVRV